MPRKFSIPVAALLGALCLLAWARTGAPEPDQSAAAAEMSHAALAFWNSLAPDLQAKAGFDFKNDERLNWHFIPRPRKGLPFKEMSAEQKLLAQALLATGLSPRGKEKALTIMSLEQVLHEIEKGKGTNVRDPELYFVSIFGKPAATGVWGWRVEGHHFATNFLVAGGKTVVSAPVFFGGNPQEVRAGPKKGLRVLGAEEDIGRELVKSLGDDLRAVAIIAKDAPKDIISGAARKAKPLEPMGLSASKLSDAQKALLKNLIREYVDRVRPEVAGRDLERIEQAGMDKVHFAWAGDLEPGKGHYYRVQGPTFLIEFDNTQNGANHSHTVYRDLENDFGEDTLRRHYEQNPHDK